MASEIKVSSVKAKDGTTGISIADSTGRVTFTETNPVITLGSNTTGLVGGTGAFMARTTGSSWTTVLDQGIVNFNDDSTGDSYDTDGNFNAGTYKYEVPATGVYFFFYCVYTANSDSSNSFGFTTNNGEFDSTFTGTNIGTAGSGNSDDHTQTGVHMMPLTSGDTVWVAAREDSDLYPGHTYWGGCRLK
ncbi:hypothetical protein [uncultured Mediterranean phage uvMED]|nr:hypothetical protein [uncultured Mediterranean phage uvMED]